MCKTILKLIVVLSLLLANELSAGSGTTKVPVRDRYFSINYALYGYQIDSLVALRNPTQGTLTITNGSYLEYTTQNYGIIDTIAIILSYTFPNDSTNTIYSDTIEMHLDVLGRANTIASFYAISGPLSAEFFNASGSDSTNLRYLWDFGDNSGSTQLNPEHQYTAAGAYNVCLTAYSSIDSNRYCETVTIFDSTFMQANADVLYYYFPDSAAYTSLKDNDLFYGNASVSICQQGNFGQASIANGVLKYTVDSFVNYTYDMVRYVLNNGTVTDTGEVYIYHYIRQDYAYCQPDFNTSSVLKTVSFTNMTKCGGNNSAKSYSWNFGDSSFSTQKNPVHTYSSYGTYNVCIETTDSLDVKLSTCKFIYVYDNRCQPEFGYTVGINEASFHPFENCPDALAYEWDFGDSSTSNELYPVHQYATTGTYTVCLTKFGFTDTVTVCKSVTVLDTNALIAMEDYVVLQYSANEVESKVLSNDIFYQNVSLSLVTQPSLVDARVAGSKLYLKSKRLVFTGEDQFEYSICKGGNCDTTRVSLTLIPLNDLSDCKPAIDYTISGTSIQLDVTDNCKTGDSLIAFYWYFSDGDTAMQRQAVHDFVHPGVYSVSLTAFDTSGRASYTSEIICIVDSSINNGNLLAVDDQLSTNIFSIGNRYNVLYNDVNLNFKKAYTTAIKDFNHGLTLFDTMGNLMWLPDSAYRGCDTMQYAVFGKDNSSVIDTATVFICFEDFPWCVDSTLIDTSYNCGNIDMPVCGCNGVEYKNACEAYTRGGLAFYLHGPCSNYIPDLSLNQSSSRIVMYNDEIKEMGYTVKGTDTKNLDIELAADNDDCVKIKHNKSLNTISISSCANYTGYTKFYTTVCDDFGACNIDTFYVNVMSRLSTGIDLVPNAEFSIYPNPATQVLSISSAPGLNYQYSLYSITGVQLLSGDFNGAAQLDLSALSQGMYLLNITTSSGDLLKVEKIIKN